VIRDILSIRAGECRFCVTDDTPFFFCADPVADNSVYCATHHAVCYAGFGQEVRRIEAMIYAMEQSVVRTGRNVRNGDGFRSTNFSAAEPPVTAAVDVQIRGTP
jgi:hypothetical protein